MRKIQSVTRISVCGLALLGAHASVAAADEPAAALKALSSLEGVWQTPVKDGAQTEFVYVPLFNGQMLTTMMAVKDGQATRYELRVIKVDGNQIVFHEDGFKPDLSPSDPVPPRPLLSHDKSHLNFQDMKVTMTGRDSGSVELTLHPPGAPARNVTLQLHRTLRFTATH